MSTHKIYASSLFLKVLYAKNSQDPSSGSASCDRVLKTAKMMTQEEHPVKNCAECLEVRFLKIFTR